MILHVSRTGDAQPADVTIQRPFKLAYKKQFQVHLVNHVHQQLKSGTCMCHVACGMLHVR
jgi:hypothetical protein